MGSRKTGRHGYPLSFFRTERNVFSTSALPGWLLLGIWGRVVAFRVAGGARWRLGLVATLGVVDRRVVGFGHVVIDYKSVILQVQKAARCNFFITKKICKFTKMTQFGCKLDPKKPTNFL